MFFFFFFKQKTAYEMLRSLVGSEMCIRDRYQRRVRGVSQAVMSGKKESVIDLSKYIDQPVRVKLLGGREVIGTLRGYDPLVNLVLDEALEFLRDPDDPYRVLDESREIGLVVARGPSVMLICPMDGTQEIPNPFLEMTQEEAVI
eukprot:TRINITY_DN12176_c0_g1_i4.p1 TRINITY_DN12176_c0_g1~~TRINITY_DN12176_c0_g1_i4.p1  ORF type:complete len:145 (+),score=64.66 TRINITY_DN12176_c0_g1_i4:118-552(+)